MKSHLSFLSIGLLMLSLIACGQKGPLYLPNTPEQSSDKNKQKGERYGAPLYKDARAWQ